jgi:TRAP-type C4-dicarboxylate transport system substrate-binding protein
VTQPNGDVLDFPEASERAERAAAAYLKLTRAAWSVTGRILDRLPVRISLAQFTVLSSLRSLGPLRPRDLSRKILSTSGNVTQVVSRLEADGLVVRSRSEDDRRVVIVTITEKGLRTIEELLPAFFRAVEKEFGVFTDQDLDTYATLSRKLGLGKFVSFLAASNPLTTVIPSWAQRVTDVTDGLITISWKGGPEEIGPTEQMEAVVRGEVDGAFIATSWYESLAREMQAMSLSEHTPWDERENGYFEFFSARHAKLGLVYLGRWLTNLPFFIWTDRPVRTPSELKGLRLRTRTGHADCFLRELGAEPVSVDPGGVKQALEAGEVSGFLFPLVGVAEEGWADHVKYIIDHGFYASQNATIIMNPKSWAKLTANQQRTVIEATADFERQIDSTFKQMQKLERRKLKAMGVEFVRFTPEDSLAYTSLSQDSVWRFLEAQVPELMPEIRRLSQRK